MQQQTGAFSVNRFDLAKERLPSGEGVLPIKIRTMWYVVNITFFANDLFSNILKKDVAKFVSSRKWLPGLGLNQRPSD